MPPGSMDSTAVYPSYTQVSVTPAPSSSQAQVVVFDLNTLVTIPDFNRFYKSSPDSFQPFYYALSDGSLVAPPFLSDIRITNISLIITTCLLTIFIRNIFVSAMFVWTGRVRNKGLLYTVFISQLFALPALIPLLAAQFQRGISCQVVMRVAIASGGISLSLLITGILGVKAYRCLNNSRLVLILLVALRAAALIILTLDLVSLHGLRSISGHCYRFTGSFSAAFAILLFVESFFVCLCFLYAVWKSHGSVAVRGRIAISLSFDDATEPPPMESQKDIMENTGGWWDYVATVDHSTTFPSRSRITESVGSYLPSVLIGARDGVARFHPAERVGDVENNRSSTDPISSLPAQYNSPPPRASTVRMSTVSEALPNPRSEGSSAVPRRPSSPSFSSTSRMSRYIPRIALFREVMRDELCYTSFITVFTVVSVVLTAAGVHGDSEMNHVTWIGFDWALISCLVVHSFGRVIRRHEHEALLQQPSAWHRELCTDRGTAQFLGEGRGRTIKSPVRRTSQARTRRYAPASRWRDVVGSSSNSSTRHLSASVTSQSSRGGDTRSIIASSIGTPSVLLSPIHKVESFNEAHSILPTHQTIPDVDHFPFSGPDTSSSHRSNTSTRAGGNVLGLWYDSHPPSLPPESDPADDQRSFPL